MMPQSSPENLGSLLGQLVLQIEELLSAHLRLVREELTADGKRMAAQSVGVATGAIMALLGLVFVGIALMEALKGWLPAWAAALAVAVGLLGGGGLLAFSSLKRLGRINPVDRTRINTQETVQWLTRR
jgi:Putative Actinobacterial Holin-X, holin superfamily III